MNINCLQCGKKVPRHGQTKRVFTPGTNYTEYRRVPNDRAGEPNVSSHMCRIDPKGYFCTMRCAVRYAVETVDRIHKTGGKR